MTDRQYWVLVTSFIPFRPVRCGLLLSYFGSAKKIWQADSGLLLKLGLTQGLVTKFSQYRSQLNPKHYFTALKQRSIKYLTHWDEKYPRNLKNLPGAPVVLYLQGNLRAVDQNAVAIVGARKMTSYGKSIASFLAQELAGRGLTIVSGLARGIDTAAHEAALAAGGRTLAVLGCGLDRIYPPENKALARSIVKNGALISEYPVGYPVYKTNFVNRNRIISGLAKAVVVVEGEKHSGTLLTASHAADQGRTVFAVPGRLNDPNSAAPLYLIKNGAKIVTETADILEELD